MATQNYKNHTRYYPPHHFIFYPLTIMLFIISLCCMFRYPCQLLLWGVMALLVLAVISLSFMLRQHYALINQNRTVRLELRFRYYVLTHKRFEEVESRLSESQVFALRFAPDEELPALVDKALNDGLKPDQIKKAIKNWLPDGMRV